MISVAIYRMSLGFVLSGALIIFLRAPVQAADTTAAATNFRIIDYKPVGYRLQRLIVSPSFNVSSHSASDPTSYEAIDESASTNGSGGASANHYYRSQSSMSDLELSTSASANEATGASSQRSSPVEEESFSSTQEDPNLYCSASNRTRFRRYLSKGLFFECMATPFVYCQPDYRSRYVDAWMYSQGADSSHYTGLSRETESNYYSVSSAFNAGIGAGWVADVTGAAIALYMADRIATASGRAQKFTNEQMQNLALAVDRLRRRRIFDTREANIESIDTLCQTLISQKFMDTANVRLAMELNDIWNYGFNQRRYYGREIKCMPLAEVHYDRSELKERTYFVDSIGPADPAITAHDVSEWPATQTSSDQTYDRSYAYSYGAEVSASFSRPCGRFFQLDGSVAVSGTMNTIHDSASTDGGSAFNGTFPNAVGSMSLTFSWYPSIRSSIVLNSSLMESADFRFTARNVSGEEFSSWAYSQRRLYYTSASSSLQVSYYISPRCSYQIWGSAQYGSGTKRYTADGTYYSTYGHETTGLSFGTSLSYAVF
jgi:hypothetical protein